VMEKRHKLLRFIAYGIEIAVLYVLSGTPGLLPEIFGSKPSILLAVALSIAVFESECAAMAFGCACGVLTDIGFTGKIGFYTIVLTILCFAIGYCARNFFVTNLLNASIIGIVSIIVLTLVHFWVNVSLAEIDNAGMQFVLHYISRIIYTSVFFIPLFFLNKLLCSTLKNQ